MNSPRLLQDVSLTSKYFALGELTDRVCRGLLLGKLEGIRRGRIEITDAEGTRVMGEAEGPGVLSVRLQIHRNEAYSKIALGGSIGAGESYFSGDWDCDHLTSLIRIFVINRELLESIDGGVGKVLAPFQRLAHRMRKNSIEGSSRNIQAHYDLGNDFFSLFLDPTWMYSCGIFSSPTTTMEEASVEKIDRICRKLELTSSDHVVEIGTGWGGFALHAASRYGCEVTTTTISRAQYQLAVERVQKAGLENRVHVLFEDYRNLKGVYDKLVSIEMIEAVGLDHLGTYFEKCSSLIKTNGQMLLQGITIRDDLYESARRNVDFIQRYIFPGSGIPSLFSIYEAVKDETDLKVFHQEELGPHYARTLRAWSESLRERQGEVIRLGYPEELYRMWQFYFSYCEGGFAERSIGCSQILFTKPECRREPIYGVLPAPSNQRISQQERS